jgi:hypothetical protein
VQDGADQIISPAPYAEASFAPPGRLAAPVSAGAPVRSR